MFDKNNAIHGQFQGQYTEAENKQFEVEFTALTSKLLFEFEAGTAVSEERVQELVAEHFAFVSRFWTPDREAYKNLALNYLLPTPYRDAYEKQAVGFAQFHYDAMVIWADSNLT
jgi:hypothetical protein